MPSDEELKQEIRQRLDGFCRERGYVLAPHFDAALNDFVRMYRLLGDFYCPCQIDNTPETVCVCAAARQGLVDEEGACFCYLVLRPDRQGTAPWL